MGDKQQTARPKTVRVALRIADWSSWARDVVRGVQHFAHGRADWNLHIAGGDLDPRAGHNRIEFDGLITHRLVDVASIRRLMRTSNTKIVTFSSNVPTVFKGLPRVKVDDAKMAESIGRHLISGGFRQFAFYGLAHSPNLRHENSRWEALKAFATAQGLPCEAFIQTAARSGSRAQLNSISRWLKRSPKPLGVVTWNVGMARLFAEACQAAELSVPEEVAIVSWDDDPMIAQAMEPSISAAVLPAEKLGYESARLLDAVLSGRVTEPFKPVLVEPSGLIRIRKSSDVSALKDRDVFLAVQYIREHAIESIRVSDVAAAVGISRSKLESEFRRILSQTPRDVIVSVRLEYAKQLLLETDWPTSQIAQRSGFGTEPTLRAAFIAGEKTTPGNYRARFGRAGIS